MSGFSFSARVSTEPVGDPPDKQPGGEVTNNVSFRDKVLGKPPCQQLERRDLLKENIVQVEFEGGNKLLPKFHIAADYLQRLCEPWVDALIIKILGKFVGYQVLQEKLQRLWKLSGGFEMRDVGHGYYMVKFDNESDREKVIVGGPWMVFDHYLTVRTWSPEFVASEAKIETTLVWLRFPDLNMAFFDESLLLAMASTMGRPLKVDTTTLTADRGRFARVCVEINLNTPVVGKFWLLNKWYHVEYEGLHLVCAHCGCYGHLKRDCPSKPAEPAEGVESNAAVQVTPTMNDAVTHTNVGVVKSAVSIPIPTDSGHGDWLVVQRKKGNGKANNVRNQGRNYEVRKSGDSFHGKSDSGTNDKGKAVIVVPSQISPGIHKLKNRKSITKRSRKDTPIVIKPKLPPKPAVPIAGKQKVTPPTSASASLSTRGVSREEMQAKELEMLHLMKVLEKQENPQLALHNPFASLAQHAVGPDDETLKFLAAKQAAEQRNSFACLPDLSPPKGDASSSSMLLDQPS